MRCHGPALNAAREAGDGPEARVAWVQAVLAKRKPVDLSTCDHIDWWCGKISPAGRALRSDLSQGGWGSANAPDPQAKIRSMQSTRDFPDAAPKFNGP